MNKLKFRNLSPTPLLVILAVFVFVAVPVRTFQLIKMIDPATGFWSEKGPLVYLLYIVIALFILIALVMTAFAGLMAKPTFKNEKNIPLGIFASLLAASLVYESALNISDFVTLMSSFVTATSSNLYTYLTSTGALPLILEGICGVLAIVYFIYVAIGCFKGSSIFESKRILALSPVLWAMFRLIYHFIDPIDYKNVSQLFLELIMLCFVMIFFLSFARIASGINEEKSMWILWFTGACATLLSYTCALAPFILTITGKGSLIPDAYPLHFCDLGIALFITSFLFTVTPLTNEVED